MGPRAAARGNPGAKGERRYSASLQWGREQLLAEISSLKLPLGSHRMLQWGREQLLAEIQWYRGCAEIEVDASMGPRAAARGNAAFKWQWSRCKWLQWGREQLLAEMRIASP